LPDSILIRGETDAEKAARTAAEKPVRTFLVVELFPKLGAAAIREQDLSGASREEVVRDLAGCQWDTPWRVLFIDEESGICRDVSAEIASALLADAEENGDTLHPIAQDFCSRHPVLRSAAA
jgi:hypothetical protein